MVADQEGNWTVNHQPYTLAPLPSKVENFIQRRDQTTQERINVAFEYITRSHFDTKILQQLNDYMEGKKNTIAIG